MTGREKPCPIWGTIAHELNETLDYTLLESPRAGGRYCIAFSIDHALSLLTDQQRACLTTWLLDQRMGDWRQAPTIHSGVIDEVKNIRPLSVLKRADRLLQYLADQSTFTGAPIHPYKDKPALGRLFEMGVWSECIKADPADELSFLLGYLSNQQRVKLFAPPPSPACSQEIEVTVQGYSHLEELQKTVVDSAQGFVAMWFGQEMQSVYDEGIAPAIEDAGYIPFRIDRHEHSNLIDNEIVAAIRRSRFVVADFTHGGEPRGGVYYEAGFAHGLDRHVIFSCRKDRVDSIHFDLEHFNCIRWSRPEELREALAKRISAVIGDGPHKTPPS